MAVQKLSTACLLLIAIVSLVASSRVAQAEEGKTLILFGASWCAPCIGELRELVALSDALPKGRIIVAWTDGGLGKLHIERPANVELANAERSSALAARFAGDIAGLPHSVMLDGRDRICARWRRPLTPDGVRGMLRECAAASR